ncbi:hypothetical protein EAD96_14785 [Micromonospora sp. BL1]|uniref:hypothetical protein n=1 Tax=Micromonospora TaxID=1873 RepID=UPI000EF5AE88|nr:MULTISPECIES: hypothetical protein [unclassified Micromonospora]MCO1614622.1 hypothetical protein [Micromonospora sp. CPM1]RLQ04470.1 hypothetical protein EAD96_14785 [Micromonospora sp. BL1]
MRSRRLVALALTATLLTAPAGCGDDEPPAAGGAPPGAGAPVAEPTGEAPAEPSAGPVDDAAPQACTLVSKADAERLAGTALDEPVVAGQSCTYTGPVTGPTAQVEVFVGEGAKKYLDIERQLGHEIRELAGTADEALLTAEAFFLRKGELWVAVRLVRLNDPQENRAPLERLARTVAGRM